MKKTYSNRNPICPYSKKDCSFQDMDGYTNCSNCSSYGNGVRATGALPILGWIITKLKNLSYNLFNS